MKDICSLFNSNFSKLTLFEMTLIFIPRTAYFNSFSFVTLGFFPWCSFFHCNICRKTRRAEKGEKGKMLKISLYSVASMHQCKEGLVFLFDTLWCLSLIGNRVFFICNRTPIFASWGGCRKSNEITCTIWKIWPDTSWKIPFLFLKALGHVFTSWSSCIPVFSVTVILVQQMFG